MNKEVKHLKGEITSDLLHDSKNNNNSTFQFKTTYTPEKGNPISKTYDVSAGGKMGAAAYFNLSKGDLVYLKGGYDKDTNKLEMMSFGKEKEKEPTKTKSVEKTKTITRKRKPKSKDLGIDM